MCACKVITNYLCIRTYALKINDKHETFQKVQFTNWIMCELKSFCLCCFFSHSKYYMGCKWKPNKITVHQKKILNDFANNSNFANCNLAQTNWKMFDECYSINIKYSLQYSCTLYMYVFHIFYTQLNTTKARVHFYC